MRLAGFAKNKNKHRVGADVTVEIESQVAIFITITYMMSLCFAGLIVFPRGPLGGQVGTSGVNGWDN